jgi:hypothetical protein
VVQRELFRLMSPAVPLCLLAGESHELRVAALLDTGSVAAQWLMSG